MTYLVDTINATMVPDKGVMVAMSIEETDATSIIVKEREFTSLINDRHVSTVLARVLKQLIVPLKIIRPVPSPGRTDITISLKSGDVLLVAQYNGGKLKWIKVTIV